MMDSKNINKVFIIAEAGVNSNGNLDNAYKLIDVAVEAFVDAVKFQIAVPEAELSLNCGLANYQKQTASKYQNQFDMAREIHLPINCFSNLKEYAENKGIIFLCSAFSAPGLNELSKLGLEYYKIPSGEITNYPYLCQVGRYNKKIIMSTGMSTVEEIKKAVNVLLKFGTKRKNITLLHCNTEYPTPKKDVNLKAMLSIRDELGLDVGYSDHTLGIEIPVAAVAMGARVIEKHFTLDRSMPGPDHRASLEPEELKKMVIAIRNVENAMGDGIKKPSLSEKENIIVVRKSIVANKLIKKGELFTEDNLAVKRPGTGRSPMDWNKIIGKTADREYKPDQLIL